MTSRNDQIVEMYYGKDMTMQAIADVVGISKGSVSGVLNRYRARTGRTDLAKNPGPAPTRARDGMVLDWLALRAHGHSNNSIARAKGSTKETVQQATNAVIRADIAAEPAAASFWGCA